MRPSRALELRRDAVLTTLARHGLSNGRVFGSVLHGADTDESDLDLLVDAGHEITLLDLVRAQHEIEDTLGVAVDLLTAEDLPAHIRIHVLGEAIPV